MDRQCLGQRFLVPPVFVAPGLRSTATNWNLTLAPTCHDATRTGGRRDSAQYGAVEPAAALGYSEGVVALYKFGRQICSSGRRRPGLDAQRRH